MHKYKSNIVFLYYKDFAQGCKFIEEVLKLTEVMDQGWAKVYQINETSFLGAVDKKERVPVGDSLVSLNTSNVMAEYHRVKELDVKDLTSIKFFEDIPLRSFFFKDSEGHDFEIQEFIDDEHKKLFKY